MSTLSVRVRCLRTILLTTAVLLGGGLLAQPFWAKDVGGVGNDHVADVQVDQDGSIYITGEFGGTMVFGGQSYASAGSIDLYVAKLDPMGNVLWCRTGGGPGIDRGLKLSLGAGTTLAVTGEFLGSAVLQGQTITSAGGTADMFVALLNKSDGQLQWVRQGGGPVGTDRPYGVTMGPDGRVAVAGEFRGTATWEGSSLTSMTDPGTGQPSSDVFVASYTSTGALQWLKQGRAKYADRAIDVTFNGAGDLYVTGQFSDTITFDQTHVNAQLNASFLVKFNGTGQEVWFRRMAGAGFNHVRDLLLKPDGRLLLLGDVQGTMIYFGSPQVNVPSGEAYAYYVLEVDANGQLLDQVTVGSNSGVSAAGIDLRGGTVAVLGQFNCRFTDLGAMYGEGVFMAVGEEDLFVTKHNSANLDLVEGQQFGGRSAKTPGAIASLPGGDLVFCGSYERNLIFPAVVGFAADINSWGGGLAGNGTPNYCNDSNYGQYAANTAEALTDGFLARGYVPGRQPYDWWHRTGTGCDRVELDPCIRQGNAACQDTVFACGSALLNVRLDYSHSGSSNNHFLGPEVDYQWSTGSAAATLTVSTTGIYGVTVRSRNGCYEWTDSIHVVISPAPAYPVISDDMVVNVAAVNPTNLVLCDPQTQWVWAGNLQAGNTHYWVAPGTNGLQVFNDSIQVDTSGTYTFYTVTPEGCLRQNSIIVIDNPSPVLPDLSAVFQIQYPDDTDGNDTLRICPGAPYIFQYTPTWTVNGVVGPLPPGLQVQWGFSEPPAVPGDGGVQQATFPASGPGWSVHRLVVKVSNEPCGQDSILFYATDSIYVETFPSNGLTVDLEGPTVICDGDSALLVATCTGCTTIDWTGTGLVVVGADSMWVTSPGSVMVSSAIIDAYGCEYQASDVLAITMPTGPVLTVAPANGVICPGQTASLSTTVVGTGHVWYGPSGPITGMGATLVTSTSGDYYLMMEVAGCPVTSNSVTLENYGTPYLDAAPGPVLCSVGDEVTLQVMATSGATVVWNAPLSGTALAQTVSTPGTYSCSVTACGITTPVQIIVTLATVSAEVSTIGPYTLCNGDSVLLQGITNSAVHHWLPGMVTAMDLMVTQTGAYRFLAQEGNCTDSSAVVLVTAISFPDTVVAYGDTVCAGDAAVLTASGSGQMMWYADPDGTQLLGQGNTFQHVAQASTTVYVTQEEDVCTGATTAVHIEVLPRPEVVTIQGPDSLCVGMPLEVVCVAPDSVGVLWSTPSGPYTTRTILRPSAELSDTGPYTCVAVYNGCASAPAVLWIDVLAPVHLDLPLESVLCTGGMVQFVLPPGFTQAQWSTGSTAHSIAVTAGAQVQLNAVDVHGCAASIEFVVIEQDCDLVIPNVFTPNGDGTNEFWYPTGGFLSASALIYNRWGGLVHEGDMVKMPWRGRHQTSGEPCSEGVYYYVLAFARADGSSIQRAGYIQLNR